MNCPNCNAEIEEISGMCPKCGVQLFFCLKCSAVHRLRRCPRCGSITVPASDRASMMAVRPSMRPMDASTRKDMHRRPVHTDAVIPRNPVALVRRDIEGVTLQLSDGALIGRTKGHYVPQMCALGYVSGTHARLNYDPIKRVWTITDLGSTNGTKINGQAISPGEATPFRIGDVISIAFTDFLAQ